MSAITIDGDLVHYEVLGRGRPVVLIHGWLGSWRYWVPTMQQFQSKFRVYALDLFGFGDSSKNPNRYSLEHQVGMLAEFTRELGVPKTAMIGHGLGALLAAEFAKRYPDRVPRLVLVSAPLFDPGDLDKRAPAARKIMEKVVQKASSQEYSPEAPTILTPLAPAAAGTPPAASADALAISVEAVRMDRSVMNATVGYRVTLRNRTAQTLAAVSVEADLVSASKDRPAEAQLASPGHALTPRHTAERLAPGQSLRFEGQVRLPLAEASAVWQGRVGLLVPLLRVRATAAGAAPIATTLVIGRREGAAARPQPFRLDEPPRSYAPLAQRTLEPLAQRSMEIAPARA